MIHEQGFFLSVSLSVFLRFLSVFLRFFFVYFRPVLSIFFFLYFLSIFSVFMFFAYFLLVLIIFCICLSIFMFFFCVCATPKWYIRTFFKIIVLLQKLRRFFSILLRNAGKGRQSILKKSHIQNAKNRYIS